MKYRFTPVAFRNTGSAFFKIIKTEGSISPRKYPGASLLFAAPFKGKLNRAIKVL